MLSNSDYPASGKTFFEKWGSYEPEPGVRVNLACKSNDGKPVAETQETQGIHTLHQLFQRGLRISRDRNCMGWRDGDDYKWWTYDKVDGLIRQTAAGLSKLNLKRQSFIGLYTSSRPNSLVATFGAVARSLVVTPLYNTLGLDAMVYIIKQTELTVSFVDTIEGARRLLEIAARIPNLMTIIVFEEPDNEILQLASTKAITLMTLQQLLTSGEDVADPFVPPTADEYPFIYYTSGTTGDPKGVMVPNRAWVADFVALTYVFSQNMAPHLKLSSEACIYHVMPLGHSCGLMVACMAFFNGASIGFWSGDVRKMVDDCQILKPNVLVLVPRMLDRLYSSLMAEIEKCPEWQSKLFRHGYTTKLDALKQGVVTRDTIWDETIFSNLTNKLGGRVDFIAIAAAAISPSILEFFRVVFGAAVVETYGLTETSTTCVSMRLLGGGVGHPIICTSVKLVDVPECGYYANDNKGEICIRGHNVMTGYYKLPEKTAEAVDSEGWFHSGDIGEILEDGSLRIIDRKKHVFKMSQGEYIAPEKIEAIYALCPGISNTFVEGDSMQNYAVAIVVPDQAASEKYAEEHQLDPATIHQDAGYRRSILEKLTKFGIEHGLNSLELVKSIYITNEQFSVENNLVTPTLKKKRPEIRKRFRNEVQQLYKEGPMIASKK